MTLVVMVLVTVCDVVVGVVSVVCDAPVVLVAVALVAAASDMVEFFKRDMAFL